MKFRDMIRELGPNYAVRDSDPDIKRYQAHHKKWRIDYAFLTITGFLKPDYTSLILKESSFKHKAICLLFEKPR